MTTEITRCSWAEKKSIFHIYHDTEWGVPVHNDQKHFEFIVLESAQAGLSWETIMKRRDDYRKAFWHFSPTKVSQMTIVDVERLMKESNIIRHRGKIEATIANAAFFLAIQKEFGSFDRYIWQFVDNKTKVYSPKTTAGYHTRTAASDALSKDMRARGFKFVGSTIMYAHMQACGLVQEHEVTCFRYGK